VLGGRPNFWTEGYSDWTAQDHMDIVVEGLKHTHLLGGASWDFWERLIKDLDRYDEDRRLRRAIPDASIVEEVLMFSDTFKRQ
jgi:hypothetical protein